MAQTKKKRHRKRRGTQGGSIDTRRRGGRPRSRAEAQARARARTRQSSQQRPDLPPTWRSSSLRGGIAALVFGVLLLVIFKRPPLVALGLAAFMLVFYVPAGYFIDMTMWRRRERARIRQRAE